MFEWGFDTLCLSLFVDSAAGGCSMGGAGDWVVSEWLYGSCLYSSTARQPQMNPATGVGRCAGYKRLE